MRQQRETREFVALVLPRAEEAVMARINLTNRFIKSDKRKPVEGRTDYFNCIVPGLEPDRKRSRNDGSLA